MATQSRGRLVCAGDSCGCGLVVVRDGEPESAGAGGEMNMEPLLTKQEVAEILHQSVPTVERRIRSGELRALRLGMAVRIDPADLRAYLNRHRTPGLVGESDGTQSTSANGSASQVVS